MMLNITVPVDYHTFLTYLDMARDSIDSTIEDLGREISAAEGIQVDLLQDLLDVAEHIKKLFDSTYNTLKNDIDLRNLKNITVALDDYAAVKTWMNCADSSEERLYLINTMLP